MFASSPHQMCVRRHSAAQGRPTRCKADFRLDLDSACAKGDFEWRCRSCDSYCCSIEQLIGCGPSLRPWAVPLLGDRGDFERAGNVATGRSGRKIRTPTKRHAPRATIPRLAATGPRSRFSRVRRGGPAAFPRRPHGPQPHRTGMRLRPSRAFWARSARTGRIERRARAT